MPCALLSTGSAWGAESVPEPASIAISEGVTTVSSVTDPTTAASSTEFTAPEYSAGGGDFSDFGDLDLAALLDAPVESASSSRETISDAPAIIEVITADQIKRWGAQTLDQVLIRLPGVEVVENHWGYININIRGIVHPLFNNKVLLLVDHHPVYEVANMGFMVKQIPINAIDKVEIIRGPGSVMYGTNAYSGVIHVFTRKFDHTGTELTLHGGLQAGSDAEIMPTGDARAAGSVFWNNGESRIFVQAQKSAVWPVVIPLADVPEVLRQPGQPAVERFEFPRGETDLSLWSETIQRFGRHSIRLAGGTHMQYKEKWGFLPDARTVHTPNAATHTVVVVSWDASWEEISARLEAGVDFDIQINGADNLGTRFGQDPFAGRTGKALETVVESSSRRMNLSGSLNWHGGDWNVSGGLDTFIHKFSEYVLRFREPNERPYETAPGMPVLDFSQFSLNMSGFSQASWRPIERLSLIAGGRLDLLRAGAFRLDQEAPPIAFTPAYRAGLIASLHPRAKLKLLYGNAFRLPSIFELFTEAKRVIHGNRELKPETIDTLDLALDAHPTDSWSLRVNGFFSRTKNQIGFRPEADGADTYVNRQGQSMYGVEATSRYLLTTWMDINASAGFQESCTWDVSFCRSTYNSNIARVIASASATLYLLNRNMDVTPMMQYIGSRQGLGGAVLWDTTLFWRPAGAWEVGLIVHNLFDKRYASPELQHAVIHGGVIDTQPRTLYVSGTYRY